MINARKMYWFTLAEGKPDITDDEVIEVLIYRSASRGSTQVTVSTGSISTKMCNKLMDLGYQLTLEKRNTGNFYQISWNRLKED